MTTATKPTREPAPAPVGEVPTETIDRIAYVGRTFGQLALDSYEHTVANLVEFEHKAADLAQDDWAKSAINLHATFVEDITAAYVRTARAALG